MKKMGKRVLSALAVLLVCLMGCSCGKGPKEQTRVPLKAFTVCDSTGAVLLQTQQRGALYDTEYWAYLELALDEAVQLIAEAEGCDTADAQNLLRTQGYTIRTAFDKTAFEALKILETQWETVCDAACALTDLHGGLVAVYCTDPEEKQINYLTQRHSPYSSFKALSVYTPAMEKGIAHWSSLYEDAPYKQIENEAGQLQDWPANVTNTYSREKVPVYEALRISLNTVAVKCLADVGVQESVEFLQKGFGIPLKEEQYVIETYGEEEVLGSIALGYLETGITPVEMAGYYQIFANGGLYAAPKAVTGIIREDGSVLYQRQLQEKQVVSQATADAMNRLLRGVVAPGGTGAQAYCKDVEVAGKTGTGDDYKDNWFVGVTPGYSLAVWHGKNESNRAAELFAEVVNKLYQALPNANRKFVTHKNLQQLAYCTRSGKAFSEGCTSIETGYYVSKDALPQCDVCNKP